MKVITNHLLTIISEIKLRKVKVLVHCAETLVSWGPLTTGEQIKEENPRVMENWRDPTTKLHAHCSSVPNFLIFGYFFAEKKFDLLNF